MLNIPSYQIDADSGWLLGVRHCPSPNCDERPSEEMSLLVVHNISLPPGRFGSGDVARFFCNQLDVSTHEFYQQIKGLKVSAHVLIERDGGITQFVPFHQRAWHAGVSSYQGRSACNDFSIGIELEGTDCHAYEEAQYEALVAVVMALRRHYPSWSTEDIVGHSDIAPDRKTDPGPAFSWSRFRGLLDAARSSEQ